MRRNVAWILIVGLVGLGTLCMTPAALAQFGGGGYVPPPPTTDPGTNPGATTTPEIDVGAAAGALTIVGGALALVGERLRRK